ncbi:frataxin-like protein [Dermatophagoides farinae]|uniref:ferroxidase n=1 Tax=Dermatophagoides farinae TaxID=6954 RepID=A0A9D4P2E3_DERFA|nr:frataxin homolog, mitochondrial-like [Dermatophagoides farinae]KAH7643496.1 frataxin-like protein [Dermatophagoides farinae]
MISIIRSKFSSVQSFILGIYIHPLTNSNSRITANYSSFHRWLSSSSQEFDEKTYEKLANKTLDDLNDRFEQFLDQIDDKNCDITFNNGVLTISLGTNGVYVMNTQTPNRQIWLSSPISGPKRYDYIDGKWIYRHDGKSIQELLQNEMEQLFKDSYQKLKLS